MLACDLCGAEDPEPILKSPGLDGPLVRCRRCGLYYVGERRSNLAFGSDDAAATTQRIRDANRDLTSLDLHEERRLAALNAKTRLDLIRKYRPSGRLLEVGCARGDFLLLARNYFSAAGVEPNEELARVAVAIAPVHQGLLETYKASDFDVAVSFHVIEHTDSPRRFLEAMAARVRPGGLIAIETPNIHSMPFRVLGKRWRQFIPEHYFFFDETTMTKLLEGAGLHVEQIARIGKFASPTLILNRLARYFRPLRYAEALVRRSPFRKSVFSVDPHDIMMAIASKK